MYLPDDITEWLKTKPSRTRSDYAEKLFRKAMEEEQRQQAQPIEPQPEEPKVEWTEEMEAIWNQRRSAINKHGRKLEFGNVGDDRTKDSLEERWYELHYGDSGYTDEEKDYEKVKAEFPSEDVAYLEKIHNLPNEQRHAIIERMEEEKENRRTEHLRRFCGGDPDEVVWQGWTRYALINRFEKDKYYSTKAVAGELGISYDQAYKHIVPFLKANGIRCG